MGSEVTSIFITGCFWYWTVCKISVTISPLREESRWHQRLANLAFALLIAIQVVGLIGGDKAIWLVGSASALNVVLILVMSKFEREGFWSKPRNQFVGSMAILCCGIMLPMLVKEQAYISLFFAVILAHEFHKAQIKQFHIVHQDLDCIRGKVGKLEAALHNARIESDAKGTPPKLSVVFPSKQQDLETRHHHNI